MSNDFFSVSSVPGTGASLSSATIRAEFVAIQSGFDKMPALSGNGSKLVAVNSGGTALEAISTIATALTFSAAMTFSSTLNVLDSNLQIKDNSDNTKILQFQASGITTGTTRTLTAPDANTTIVGTDTTQTLTAKTLTNPTINAATISGTFAGAATFSGALTLSSALTYGGVTLSNAVTGTGAMVLGTSPSFTTPVLGAATATSINGLTITSTTGGTLTIANSSTLATSGANAITLTSTGATNVTLPTTGTLATLAGVEELDNKTLDSSVGKGTWTASGTWTLPALTLGGNVSSSGNPSLNIGSGAFTAGSGTFADRVIGGTWSEDGSDPHFVSYRTISGGSDGSAHAFQDYSTFTKGAGNSQYNSFFARPTLGGTQNFNHVVGFQAYPISSTSGTVDEVESFKSWPNITAGTVTDLHHAGIYAAQGAGTITTEYGVRLMGTPGAGTNIPISSTWTGASFIAGSFGIANNKYFQTKNSSGTLYNILGVDGSNDLYLGHAGLSGAVYIQINGVTPMSLSSTGVTIASDLAVNGGDLTTSQTTFNLINATATTVNFAGGASTALNIGHASGTNTVSGLVSLAQGQLKFPATANPSADANTLDDYEEGTFTPTIIGGSTAGSQTYVLQQGKYTKIGRHVHCIIYVEISAKDGAMAGDVLVGGLPFSAGATTATEYPAAIGQRGGFNLNAGGGYYALSASVVGGNNYINLHQSGDNVSSTNIVVADIASSTWLSLSVSYDV